LYNNIYKKSFFALGIKAIVEALLFLPQQNLKATAESPTLG